MMLKEIEKFDGDTSALYQTAFPAAERKPERVIERSSSRLFRAEEEEIFCGMAVVVPSENPAGPVLLDYLAVEKSGRGKGYGGAILCRLKELFSYTAGIIIEIERLFKGETQEENNIRERRREFYLRHGYLDLPFTVMLFGVEMQLMYLPAQRETLPDYTQYLALYENAFGKGILKYVEKIDS